LRRGSEIVFQYSDGYAESWFGQYSWDYNLVLIKKPGVELIGIANRLQGGFRGSEDAYKLNMPLPYEKGRIVIADFAFVQTITKTGEHAQRTEFSFRRITQQEKEGLMQAFRNDGRFSSWAP
jgi:hypothetical protein